MNYPTAHSLASEMSQKLLLSDDFFGDVDLLYSKDMDDTPDEYAYALKAAITQRIPFENDEWRLKAIEFLDAKGIK